MQITEMRSVLQWDYKKKSNHLKAFIVCLLFFGSAHTINAQNCYSAEIGAQSLSYVSIEKVMLTDSFSIFYMQYAYKGGKERWLCTNDRYYLRENEGDEKKRLIKAEGLPWCPDNHNFHTEEVLRFKLFFPPLSSPDVHITFIQGTENVSTSSNFQYYFNFWSIKLKPLPQDSCEEIKPLKLNYNTLKVNDSIHLNILFEHGSEVLLPSSQPELDSLYIFMKKHSSVVIELNGHTEGDLPDYTTKQKKSNLALSDKRVKNVKQYLTSKGINSNRIQTKAWGGSNPISKDEFLNRRVMMRIIKF